MKANIVKNILLKRFENYRSTQEGFSIQKYLQFLVRGNSSNISFIWL